jgi:hypothetical protein
MAGITQNQPPGVASQGQPAAADEAVRICSDLIRIDATNPETIPARANRPRRLDQHGRSIDGTHSKRTLGRPSVLLTVTSRKGSRLNLPSPARWMIAFAISGGTARAGAQTLGDVA